MIVIDKSINTTCFNWNLIDRDIIPDQYNTLNSKEDLNLLLP